MSKLIFELVGCLIGIGLAVMAIIWSSDPASGALMLFFGSILVLAGAISQT